MTIAKHKHKAFAVWVKPCNLPVEYRTDEGLSVVASGIGKSLYQDSITRSSAHVHCAHACFSGL